MLRPFTAPLCFALLGLVGSATATAAPIAFSVIPNSFTMGVGYGVDVSEVTGTKLDATFVFRGGVPSPFSLSNPGDAMSFDFAAITLHEAGTISSDETDTLAVRVDFFFDAPQIGFGLRSVTGNATATSGPVDDVAVDFAITWDTTEVLFGNGGRFQIAVNDLSFRQTDVTHTATATITLLAAPTAPTVVPEPAGLALVATALAAGGAFTRRRRANAS